MFEPQDHPDDIPTRAARRAVRRDRLQHRLLDGIKYDRSSRRSTARSRRSRLAPVPQGRVTRRRAAAAICSTTEVNDAFVAVNRLLKANEEGLLAESPATVNATSKPTRRARCHRRRRRRCDSAEARRQRGLCSTRGGAAGGRRDEAEAGGIGRDQWRIDASGWTLAVHNAVRSRLCSRHARCRQPEQMRRARVRRRRDSAARRGARAAAGGGVRRQPPADRFRRNSAAGWSVTVSKTVPN